MEVQGSRREKPFRGLKHSSQPYLNTIYIPGSAVGALLIAPCTSVYFVLEGGFALLLFFKGLLRLLFSLFLRGCSQNTVPVPGRENGLVDLKARRDKQIISVTSCRRQARTFCSVIPLSLFVQT